MYSKTILFSIFFALAAVAEPQLPAVPPAVSTLISLAVSDATGGATTSVGNGATTPDSGLSTTQAASSSASIISVLDAGNGYSVATAVSKPLPTSSESSSAFVPQAGLQTSLIVALGTVLVGALLGVTMIL